MKNMTGCNDEDDDDDGEEEEEDDSIALAVGVYCSHVQP
jgi:hypothetical protein